MNTPLLTQLHTCIADLVPDTVVMKRKGRMHYDDEHQDSGRMIFEKVKTQRPITLADVLRAMNELDKEKNYNAFGLAVAVNGMFFKDREPLCQWDTSKNLNDQSTEVHEFIGKIIL